MSIKASVQKGFGVARQSLSVVGVLSLFGFAWNLVNLYYAPKAQQEPQAAASVVMVVAAFVFILLSIFLQAATMGYIRDMIKQGQSNLSVFMSSGGRYYFRMLFVGLMITSVVLIFVILGAVSFALLKTVGLVIAIPLGILAIYLIFLVFFAPYIVVVNNEGVIASIKKSMLLVKKNFMKVIGVSSVLVGVGFVIGLLVGLILGLLNVVAPGPASQIIYAVLSALLNAFLGVFVTATFMNFYLEISNTQGV